MASCAVSRSCARLAVASKAKKKTAYLMVIFQQFVQKVNGFRADKPLVIVVDKALPALFGKPAKYVVVLLVKLDVVFIEIFEEVVRAKYFGNLYKLI